MDDDLLCTEPMEDVERSLALAVPQLSEPQRYGLLEGLNASIGTFVLRSATFTIGRCSSCDLRVTNRNFPTNSLKQISNVHCILQRDLSDPASPTYILDQSTNGTQVNTVELAYRDRRILLSGDTISLGFYAAFRYFEHGYSVPDQYSVIDRRFHVGRKLGSGTFGTVFLLRDVSTCKSYALKLVSKPLLGERAYNRTKMLREVNVVGQLEHPCVVRLHSYKEEPSAFGLVLEYLHGGDLLTRIVDRGHLPENLSKFYFFQLSHAVRYLHGEGITHRDIKPDNILLWDHNEYSLLKLSDFGTSKFLDEDTVLRTYCGTPHYLAPEMLLTGDVHAYTSKVDIWSVGVTLYAMLSGPMPFANEDGSVDREAIKHGAFSNRDGVWKKVSPCATNTIRHMLDPNPNSRPCIDEVLRTEWLQSSRDVRRARNVMNAARKSMAQ